MSDVAPHIGTLREKPLHAALKRWYRRPGDGVEVPVGGYVIDLVRDDLLIEIQTSGFSSMKQKLATLLEHGHRVRIVHPIPIDKWIVRIDGEGVVVSRRRSPRHGHTTDVFAELVSFPTLLVDSDLEIEVVLTNEEEYRRHTPGRAWRRNGWTVAERRLIDVVDSVLLRGDEDLLRLLPEGLPVEFTTADLAACLGIPRRIGQQMAYCLRHARLITVIGKSGRSIEYRVG